MAHGCPCSRAPVLPCGAPQPCQHTVPHSCCLSRPDTCIAVYVSRATERANDNECATLVLVHANGLLSCQLPFYSSQWCAVMLATQLSDVRGAEQDGGRGSRAVQGHVPLHPADGAGRAQGALRRSVRPSHGAAASSYPHEQQACDRTPCGACVCVCVSVCLRVCRVVVVVGRVWRMRWAVSTLAQQNMMMAAA